jgi:hypothetical protein
MKKSVSKRAVKKAGKAIPYMQTVNAKVRLRFAGRRERRLELTISIPAPMGEILIRRWKKRLKK